MELSGLREEIERKYRETLLVSEMRALEGALRVGHDIRVIEVVVEDARYQMLSSCMVCGMCSGSSWRTLFAGYQFWYKIGENITVIPYGSDYPSCDAIKMRRALE